MSLEGEPLQKGNIRVIQRNNVGLSFGAYSDAFKLFRNEYEYFIFTEDDLSILENNYVKKSIELFESSKNAGFLAFVGKTKIKRGVLIKYPKKKQDMRVDLPTIGLDTLKDCKRAGLKGIVLKDKQNIFLEKNKCINFAIKNKMFILVK